jgi:radical SAM protein with 4Fe4S-binding SPASM domain
VLFNSNALALSRRLQQQLVDAGLDELRVSMDAADRDTYRRIRGVDGYEKALRRTADFCAYLRERGATRPRVSLVFMALRDNLEQLPAVIERAASMGVAAVTLQRLVYFGTGMAVESQSVFAAADQDEVDRLIAICEETARRSGLELNASGRMSPQKSLQSVEAGRPWSGCTRPWRSTYVTANGNVLPCCIAPFSTNDYEGIILGNLLERPMTEIWSAEEYEVFRRAHASDQPPEACRGCGSRWMY